MNGKSSDAAFGGPDGTFDRSGSEGTLSGIDAAGGRGGDRLATPEQPPYDPPAGETWR